MNVYGMKSGKMQPEAMQLYSAQGAMMPCFTMTPGLGSKMPGGPAMMPGGSAMMPGGSAMMPGATTMPAEGYASLVRNIEKYMQDEVSATAFYKQMAEEASPPKVKEYINHAAEEEQRHYRLLADLYRELTGRSFEATAQTVTFPSLREGLLRATDDELNAFEEYRDELQRHMQNARIATVFFELMTDEIEHAVRFNTALHIIAGQ